MKKEGGHGEESVIITKGAVTEHVVRACDEVCEQFTHQTVKHLHEWVYS